MRYLRLLLLPFSWLYGLIVIARNLAYALGIFSSRQFRIPVIVVGNLAVGGAGKSPMAEYIIRLLKDRYTVAVLSRGYGRKTKGYRLVHADDTVADAGDEPLQFRRKFDGITVAVAEKRAGGIERLQPDHDLVILDDAFQHRAVRAGLSILLFDYNRLSDLRLLLPAGNLREPFAGRARADVIVITKTPRRLSDDEKSALAAKIKPLKHQKLFFSYLRYGNLTALNVADAAGPHTITLAGLESRTEIFLVTGIANPAPLLAELRKFSNSIKHYDYPDHHPFSIKNITKLAKDFRSAKAASKLIVTTEKDMQRLVAPGLSELLTGLPVYYLPVEAALHGDDGENFDFLIERYVAEHLQHN